MKNDTLKLVVRRWARLLLVVAMIAAAMAVQQPADAEGNLNHSMLLKPPSNVEWSITDPSGTRFLDAQNGSQGWAVRHAGHGDSADRKWLLTTAGTFLDSIDAPCDELNRTAIGMCPEDAAVVAAGIAVDATDIVAISTTYHTSGERWLDAIGTAAVRNTKATGPESSLWFQIPVDESTFLLQNVETGRYLSRHGAGGQVTTLVNPSTKSHWEVELAPVDRPSRDIGARPDGISITFR